MRVVSSASARRAGIFVAARWRHCSSASARRAGERSAAAGSTGVIHCAAAAAAAAAGQCSSSSSSRARAFRGAAAALLVASTCPRVSTSSSHLVRARKLSSEAGSGFLGGRRFAGSMKTTSTSTSSTSTSTPAPPFSLYDHPRLYEAAFGFRDFDAEAEFLLEAWRRYSEVELEGDPSLEEGLHLPRSFLDVGCGTGRHGAALARAVSAERKKTKKKKGDSSPANNSSPPPLSLYALDNSDAMLEAAAANAEEAGCPLRGRIKADITAAASGASASAASAEKGAGGGPSFGGGGLLAEGSVDVALCALGTLAHCCRRPAPGGGGGGGAESDGEGDGDGDGDPALSALLAVAAALSPGGILVLELPAAGDLFDGTLLAGDAWDVPAPSLGIIDGDGEGGGEGANEQEQRQQQQQPRKIGQIVKKPKPKQRRKPRPLIVEYGSPDDEFDPVTQVLMRTVVVSEASEAFGGDDDDDSAAVGVGREIGRETVAQRLFTPGEVRCLAREAGFRVAAELGDMELGGPTAQEGDRYVAVLVKKKKE